MPAAAVSGTTGGVTEVDWADVPHPPTPDDGPITVVHVLRFADPHAARAIPDEMEAYSTAIARIATKQGARVAGWFAVEGTIVGDGRAWHQVRFNQFPASAPSWPWPPTLNGLLPRRNTGTRRSPTAATVIMRADIDRIAESIGS